MLFEKIKEAVAFIHSKVNIQPTIGIILGSGLGKLADEMENSNVLSYSDLPHFPKSTVEGHDGNLIFGSLGGKSVVVMAGRFHYYEGYNMEQITFPVRVMKALGIETLIVSNAAGAMNPIYKIGDIMFLRDHINLFPEHPLRGKNDDRLGIRFPDMSAPYDADLLLKAKTIAFQLQIRVQEGVYIGLQGPTFETPAEYNYLRIIGGDAVGMSTVPEIIVAVHCNLKVFAASIITDIGLSENPKTITHQEVLEAANRAAPQLDKIITGLLKEI